MSRKPLKEKLDWFIETALNRLVIRGSFDESIIEKFNKWQFRISLYDIHLTKEGKTSLYKFTKVDYISKPEYHFYENAVMNIEVVDRLHLQQLRVRIKKEFYATPEYQWHTLKSPYSAMSIKRKPFPLTSPILQNFGMLVHHSRLLGMMEDKVIDKTDSIYWRYGLYIHNLIQQIREPFLIT